MKCQTKRCRNEAINQRKICGKCKSRKYRSNNPIMSCYLNLKQNAKRRGKIFEITFEEFTGFAVKTDYLIGKGRHSESFHIDRIDESKGYTIDNIQVLTNTENIKKFLRYQQDEKGKPFHFRNEVLKYESHSSAPF